MVNHIQGDVGGGLLSRRRPTCVRFVAGEDHFTTKLQLWQSLQTYEKTCLSLQKRPSLFLPLNEFVPETFKLDEKVDRDAFFNVHQGQWAATRLVDDRRRCRAFLAGDVWICKPSGLNQGQ
jgi:hypothetical protein